MIACNFYYCYFLTVISLASSGTCDRCITGDVALWYMDSRVAACRLSSCAVRLSKCSTWDPLPEIEHCTAGWILNPWSTRKVLNVVIIMLLLFYLLSHVWLFVTPWTVACQASLSMGYSRQEYWSRFLFSSPGDLPNPGIETSASTTSPASGRFSTAVTIIIMPYVNRKFGVNNILSHALLSVMIRRTWFYMRPHEESGVQRGELGFPGSAVVKNPPANAGDTDLIPGSGRPPGEGNPLQCSCLENPMDRRAWWATFHGVAKELDMTEQLSMYVVVN